jgi:hypothetical protein
MAFGGAVWEFMLPAPFLFHCPDTQQSVWAVTGGHPRVTPQGDIFLPIKCIACEHIHLIDPGTGQVLGTHRKDDEE